MGHHITWKDEKFQATMIIVSFNKPNANSLIRVMKEVKLFEGTHGPPEFSVELVHSHNGER